MVLGGELVGGGGGEGQEKEACASASSAYILEWSGNWKWLKVLSLEEEKKWVVIAL